MAGLATTHPTLADVAKTLDPDGKVASIVEILNETNEMNEDAVYLEGNLPTGHRHSIRTGIPVPTWRALYAGVSPTRSTSAQVTDNIGTLEAYAEVDKKLADLNGNTNAFRLSEDRAHMEGMSQELQSTLLYGNEGTEPAAFTGLAPRYNSLSAANSDNIIDAGGTGTDNGSIWLIVWGPKKVHMIYPKGSKGGISSDDKGQVTIEDIDSNGGGRMEAYRTHYKADAGLAVADWRYAVRICNIDKSLLTNDKATGADLVDLMVQSLELPPNLNGRVAFYVSRSIRSMLRRQMLDGVKNSTLSWEKIAGKRVMTLGEVPVRRVDALAADEARVV